MYVIGMHCLDRETEYIRYIYVSFELDMGVYKKLNEDYKCPKKVFSLVNQGDRSSLDLNADVRPACPNRAWRENYGCAAGDKFLTSFFLSSGIIFEAKFIFKNGTWYFSTRAHTQPRLLSEVLESGSI